MTTTTPIPPSAPDPWQTPEAVLRFPNAPLWPEATRQAVEAARQRRLIRRRTVQVHRGCYDWARDATEQSRLRDELPG